MEATPRIILERDASQGSKLGHLMMRAHREAFQIVTEAARVQGVFSVERRRIHDGQEGRHHVGGQGRAEKHEVTIIESHDISRQPPADPFQNTDNSGAAASVSNSGQAGAAPNGNGGLDLESRLQRRLSPAQSLWIWSME
ncbi:hypothetical protein MTO96_041633 [Rhipicephalus appendiculatus]